MLEERAVRRAAHVGRDAEVEVAADVELAAADRCGGKRGLRAGRLSELHEPSAGAERLDRGGGGRAPQRVMHDVHVAAGRLAEGVGEVVPGEVADLDDYDRDADVLYLGSGDPATAVDFDESPDGHALRFDAAGRLVGITVVGARRLVDERRDVRVQAPVTLSAETLASIVR